MEMEELVEMTFCAAGTYSEGGVPVPCIALKEHEGDAEGLFITTIPFHRESIEMALAKEEPDWPFSHELMRNLIEGHGSAVERVTITELRLFESVENRHYVASMELRAKDGMTLAFDCMPSDGVAILLRVKNDAEKRGTGNVPKIFVRKELFEANKQPIGIHREPHSAPQPASSSAKPEDPLEEMRRKFLGQEPDASKSEDPRGSTVVPDDQDLVELTSCIGTTGLSQFLTLVSLFFLKKERDDPEGILITVLSHRFEMVADAFRETLPKLPFTPGFMRNLIEALGARVRKFVITGFEKFEEYSVWYAQLELETRNGEILRVDCQPADAMAVVMSAIKKAKDEESGEVPGMFITRDLFEAHKEPEPPRPGEGPRGLPSGENEPGDDDPNQDGLDALREQFGDPKTPKGPKDPKN